MCFVAVFDAVHAAYAAGVIKCPCFRIDAGAFAIALASPAMNAFGLVNHRAKNREARNKAEKCSHRANGIAVGAPFEKRKSSNQHKS